MDGAREPPVLRAVSDDLTRLVFSVSYRDAAQDTQAAVFVVDLTGTVVAQQTLNWCTVEGVRLSRDGHTALITVRGLDGVYRISRWTPGQEVESLAQSEMKLGVQGVNQDGAVFVGDMPGRHSERAPYRWSAAGREELPFPDSRYGLGCAYGVSADGGLVMARYKLKGTAHQTGAFVLATWAAGTGLQTLSPPPGSELTGATPPVASADAARIATTVIPSHRNVFDRHAAVWTNGTAQRLPAPPRAAGDCPVQQISADGRLVGGGGSWDRHSMRYLWRDAGEGVWRPVDLVNLRRLLRLAGSAYGAPACGSIVALSGDSRRVLLKLGSDVRPVLVAAELPAW